MANSSQSEQQSIILKHLQSHVSVRQFMDSEVTVEQERVIVSTATRSATSSNLHSYSIIAVRNSQSKERISELSGNQEHIRTCGLFLVFCADLYRLSREAAKREYPYQGDTTEALLIATVDAALAADRALIAAQALGLGGVMVGAIRNNPQDIADLLQLPHLVYAVMGMSIGHPAKIGQTKPRIPLTGLLHREQYEDERLDAAIREYDETVRLLAISSVVRCSRKSIRTSAVTIPGQNTRVVGWRMIAAKSCVRTCVSFCRNAASCSDNLATL